MSNQQQAEDEWNKFARTRGYDATDATLEWSRHVAQMESDHALMEFKRGNLALRHNFACWNVKLAMAFQQKHFEGFEVVFGSMGFPVGRSVFYEYGGAEYKTCDDFGLGPLGKDQGGRGYDGHFWLANKSTGEVADVPFGEYRFVSDLRCEMAAEKKSYKMKAEFEGRWVIATGDDWRKFGMVHLPAPAVIQATVLPEMADTGNCEFDKTDSGLFQPVKVMRVAQKK
jgi:hypothetical protein